MFSPEDRCPDVVQGGGWGRAPDPLHQPQAQPQQELAQYHRGRRRNISVAVRRKKDAKGQHTETGILCSHYRRHLIVQICTMKVKHRLSTPLQKARDWSVLPREGGWSRSTEAGDRSRLTKMLRERSREPGVELKTRGEAPQERAEDKTGRWTVVTPGTEAMRS